MNRKKLNLLFVSIAFPPKSDSEGLQVAKYFKYLVRDKYLNIDVVTSSDDTLFMPIDESLREYIKGYRQIIKVPFFENKYINFLIRKINPSSLNYPDSKFRFYKKWKSIIKQLKDKPDIIYSRSFPLSSSVMAYHLQKELQVPWILHLSDPWTISPIHKLGNAQAWNEKMEYECFEAATILSFTSVRTIEVYTNKYPQFKSKMKLFSNVFDVEDKIESTYIKNKKIQVVYTGGLVENRSPRFLFHAIKKLESQNPEIIMDFEFIFAGALDRKNKVLFDNDISCVKHIGMVSYKEALALQMSADILLVIDTPFNNRESAMFFPSKLLDYMLTQKRIFALTDKESVTWDIVNEKLGDCILHDDINKILESLKTAWIRWKGNDIAYFEIKNLDMTFSAEKNAKDLADLFKKVRYAN